MIPRRLLSPSSVSSARLWTGNTIAPLSSVSQEFARTLPPAAPPLPTRPQRQPIPIPTAAPTLTIKPITATPTHPREKTVENDATSLRDQDDERLEQYFLRTLSQLPDGAHLNLEQLIQESKEKAGTVLEDISLNYESTPIPSRRVKTTGTSTTGSDVEQDGIVVVAHVVGGEKTRVNISTGFVVGDQAKDGEGRMIITCSHTLNQVSLDFTTLLIGANLVVFRQIEGHFNRTKSTSSPPSPSATLILTSSGHVYTVSSLLSSLPSSDLLLLRLTFTTHRIFILYDPSLFPSLFGKFPQFAREPREWVQVGMSRDRGGGWGWVRVDGE